MKIRFDYKNFLGDSSEAVKEAVHTVGYSLSALGTVYIDRHILNNALLNKPIENFSALEFSVYATGIICIFGAAINGLSCAYDTLKIPGKLITGKYFRRREK